MKRKLRTRSSELLLMTATDLSESHYWQLNREKLDVVLYLGCVIDRASATTQPT